MTGRVKNDTFNQVTSPRKKLPARFFTSGTGRLPVREWLLSLDEVDRRTVGKDIQKVEFGWPIGMPCCRPLGRGLWEVRSDLPGGHIARIIFCILASDMVLLHGFVKKTQRTAQQDIELAMKRRKELA
ncbi:MAG: type II toxin-antitoxin system RelE/ParE family toxin [Hyphomicrobiales bacterium]